MFGIKHCNLFRIIDILHLHISSGSENTSHSVWDFSCSTLKGCHAVSLKHHGNAVQNIHSILKDCSSLYILYLIAKHHGGKIDRIYAYIQKSTSCKLRFTDTFHMTYCIAEIRGNCRNFSDHTAFNNIVDHLSGRHISCPDCFCDQKLFLFCKVK